MLPSENDLPVNKQFKRVLSAALKRRSSMDSLDGTKAHVFVTFFDPWFKGLEFLADGEKAVVHDHVTELVQQVVDSDLNEEDKNSATNDPPCKKKALDILLGDEDTPESNEEIGKQEVLQYLAEKPSPRNTQQLL